MQLLNGRPAATPTELQDENFAEEKDRLAKEIRVYDFLDNLGIDYQRIDHAPAMTMEVCKKIDEVLEAVICKNLFLCNRQETQFYLLMMPGDKPFRTKDLSAQIGSSRLSFAKPEYMEEFLDIKPGAVSVMGLMNDTENHVQLLIDQDVLRGEWIGCQYVEPADSDGRSSGKNSSGDGTQPDPCNAVAALQGRQEPNRQKGN